MTGGHGGWPMTVFLTPAGAAVLRGHVLPARSPDRACPPSLRSWRHVHDALDASAATRSRPAMSPALLDALVTVGEASPGSPQSRWLTDSARTPRRADARDPAYDQTVWGGFGAAPKFPQPVPRWSSSCATTSGPASRPLWRWSSRTSRRMAAGGMRDHAGWRFPPVLGRRALARAALREDALRQRPPGAEPTSTRGASRDRRTCGPSSRRRSTTWSRTFAIPQGGFYAARDADSEGEEGHVFYVWTAGGGRRAAGRRRRALPSGLRRDRRGQLRGAATSSTCPTPWRRSRPAKVSSRTRLRGHCSTGRAPRYAPGSAGVSGSPLPRREGHRLVERTRDPGLRRGRRRAGPGATTSMWPGPRPTSSCASCAPTGRLLHSWIERRRGPGRVTSHRGVPRRRRAAWATRCSASTVPRWRPMARRSGSRLARGRARPLLGRGDRGRLRHRGRRRVARRAPARPHGQRDAVRRLARRRASRAPGPPLRPRIPVSDRRAPHRRPGGRGVSRASAPRSGACSPCSTGWRPTPSRSSSSAATTRTTRRKLLVGAAHADFVRGLVVTGMARRRARSRARGPESGRCSRAAGSWEDGPRRTCAPATRAGFP